MPNLCFFFFFFFFVFLGFFVFFVFFVFLFFLVFLVWLVSVFSFRKFSEILRNGRFVIDFRTLSIVSGLFSETRLFAAPIRSASLKLM